MGMLIFTRFWFAGGDTLSGFNGGGERRRVPGADAADIGQPPGVNSWLHAEHCTVKWGVGGPALMQIRLASHYDPPGTAFIPSFNWPFRIRGRDLGRVCL